MVFLNYVTGIIKILESPRQQVFENDILVTRFRGELPVPRTRSILNVSIWGNLGQDIASCYKIGDYIMVEGYLSLRNNEVLNSSQVALKKIELSVLKVYPLYSNINNSNNLINYNSDD